MIYLGNIGKNYIKLGLAILVIFVLIFTFWGILAPINSASIAPGTVVLDFDKKLIQHLEGGIIQEILVNEGQEVKKNQPLLYLSDVIAGSQNNILQKQIVNLTAIKIRLAAQRDNKFPIFSSLEKPFALKEDDQTILNQQNIYNIEQNLVKNKIDILNKQIEQLKNEISGIKSQKNAVLQEILVLEKQKNVAQELVKNANLAEDNLLNIHRQLAVSKGKFGELGAMVAKVNQAILETKLEIINYQNETLSNILEQINQVEVKILDLKEQLIAADDLLFRTQILSPTNGVVTDLKYRNIGEVIAPASQIMYIVPNNDQLIIEAHVKPIDIDNVTAGLKSKIQLTAYKEKKVPKLNAVIISVSADSLFDEKMGEQYFLARVEVDGDQISKLKNKIELYPGMPAQVFIITGKRSLFSYLFSPIIDASYKAFREE